MSNQESNRYFKSLSAGSLYKAYRWMPLPEDAQIIDVHVETNKLQHPQVLVGYTTAGNNTTPSYNVGFYMYVITDGHTIINVASENVYEKKELVFRRVVCYDDSLYLITIIKCTKKA